MSTRGEALAKTSVFDRFEESLERRGTPQVWLTLLTLAVFAQSLACGFVYDDRQLLVPPSSNGSWLASWLPFFSGAKGGYNLSFYRPVSGIYFKLMHSVAGVNPTGWHAGSVLLHLACVLLVFAFAKHLLHHRTSAFLVAALWAVHPTHVEAVTWVSAVGDPLMTLFLLLAAVSFLQWREGESFVWLAASLLAGAAALFCKETAVVMPTLISVLVLLPSSTRGRSSQLAALMAFWGESIAFLALRSHVLHGFSQLPPRATNTEMILTWPAALLFYLRSMLFPVQMTPLYDLDIVRSAASVQFLAPTIVLLGVTSAAAYLVSKSREWRLYAICVVWMLVPLVPVLYLKFFPRYELVHDRFLYVPTIGLLIAILAVSMSLEKRPGAIPALRKAVVLVLCVSAVATISYESWWQSDLALFQRAVSITPNNTTALVDLGIVLMEQKRYDAGIAILDRATQSDPNNADAAFNRGRAALEVGDSVTAEHFIERAVQLAPNARTCLFLASTKLGLGKFAEGERAARLALALEPDAAGARLVLADALLEENNRPAAIVEIEEELRRNPNTPGARQLLERAQAQN